MLSLLLFVASLTATAEPDAASRYVAGILAQGQQILELKNEDERTVHMCALLTSHLGSRTIAYTWLDKFHVLEREQRAVAEFVTMVPSILVSKAMPVLGAGGGGETTVVDEQAVVRSEKVLEVGVTVNSKGRDHRGYAIIKIQPDGTLKLIDVEYNGYTAVGYQAREYQNYLNRQYNKDPENSMPVTALIQHIRRQSDYVQCP